ncbi:MAG: hypothetical protein JWR16_1256 [Nevskia sp.]|nr:hypothetical protein [Nevskia sp.]
MANKTSTAWLRVIPFASGLLFGFGLILSGMTDPLRILAFLDVAGSWNPSLAFVMGGAIAVTFPAFAYARRRGHTLAGEALQLPDRTTLTPRLVIGSALFGVGWGLSGVCPGPALVIAAGGAAAPLLFVASMLVGMALYAVVARPRTRAAVSAAQ